MDIAEYVTTLRRRWPIVAATVLAGLLVSAVMVWQTPRTYTASARSFVTIGSSDGSSTIVQQSQFTLERVKSYTQLVSSPDVLQPVIDDLGMRESVDDLRSQVSAKTPLNTVLLDVTAEAGSAGSAARIADAVSRQLGDTVKRLEKPAKGSSPVVVTLIEPAAVPSAPASPRPPLYLGLGLLIGLALGLALAVLRDRLDSTVRTEEDLRRAVDVPQLGTIAYDRGLRRRHLPAADRDSPSAEQFRTLRTNLRFVDVDNPVRQVVVTSAVAYEGKTTAACNLAVSLAESGLRVGLVEADLRRPKVAEYFGIEGGVGLTDVVTGSCSLDEALVPWGPRDAVQILTAGRRPPDANSVLGSAAVADLMRELSTRFDVVVYDAPPLALVTDAALLARRTDGALLVVRRGHAKRAQVLEAVRTLELAGGRLLGTVLTFAPGDKDKYSYGYAAPKHLGQAAKPAGATARHTGTARAVPMDELIPTGSNRSSHRSDDGARR